MPWVKRNLGRPALVAHANALDGPVCRVGIVVQHRGSGSGRQLLRFRFAGIDARAQSVQTVFRRRHPFADFRVRLGKLCGLDRPENL
jgi:hypothetical protein